MREFVEAWSPLFEKHGVTLYIVWDLVELPAKATHLSAGFRTVEMSRANDIPGFVPTGTDMIRSWGFYHAWFGGDPYILTLDDDVRPGLNDIFDEYERAFHEGASLSRFLDVGALTTAHEPLRGFPYRDRKRVSPMVQYGAWSGVLDYDAATQLSQQPHDHHVFSHVGVLPVPRGVPVTTCIMNCAFRREFTPAMWQLPMLDGKYNRFGDIWSGLFQKRTLDILGELMVLNNSAYVKHERASDPITNLEREAPGIRLNETLADAVFDEGMLTHWHAPPTMADAYRVTTSWAASVFPRDYREHFLRCRDEWLALFA